MRKLIMFLALILCALPAFAQGQTPTAATLLGGQISASSTACATALSCVWMAPPQNTGTVVVSVTGTFSGTLQFEGSIDGTTFVSIGAQTVPSGVQVTSTTGTGTFVLAVSGFVQVRVRASALSSGIAAVSLSASSATAANSGLLIGNIAGSTDPCQNPSVIKSSAPVNISTATTTAVVAVSGSKAVYVCGGALTIAPSATSADTATFEYGSGTACATSPTALSGALGAGDLTSAAPPIVVPLGYGGMTMTAPSATGLCILSAGTAVSIQGWITYVQQ